MSLETLEATIAVMRFEFNTLNRDRFDRSEKYVGLSEPDEKKLCDMADEISLLQFTKSVMGANSVLAKL